MLYFRVVRSQRLGRATVHRNRIEQFPPGLLPGKYNFAIRSPKELLLGNHIAKRASLLFFRFPYLSSFAAGDIDHSNGKRLRLSNRTKLECMGISRYAQKHEALAVGRPDRDTILIDTRIRIVERAPSERIQPNQAVRLAAIDKGELRTVRRARQLACLAFQADKLPCAAAILGRLPDLAGFQINNAAISVARFSRVSFHQLFWRGAVHAQDPDGLVRLGHRERRVGDVPLHLKVTATSEKQRRAIARPNYLIDFLAVVVVERGGLARLPIRRRSKIDVAFPLFE